MRRDYCARDVAFSPGGILPFPIKLPTLPVVFPAVKVFAVVPKAAEACLFVLRNVNMHNLEARLDEALTSLQTSGAKSVVTVVRTLVGRFTGPTAVAKLVASLLLVIATARSAVNGDGKRSCECVAVGSCALSLVLDRLADVLHGLASS